MSQSKASLCSSIPQFSRIILFHAVRLLLVDTYRSQPKLRTLVRWWIIKHDHLRVSTLRRETRGYCFTVSLFRLKEKYYLTKCHMFNEKKNFCSEFLANSEHHKTKMRFFKVSEHTQFLKIHL